MQLARSLPSQPIATVPDTCDCDRPIDVEAGSDAVTLSGPLAALTMTADAAIETAHRLFEAALAAKRIARNELPAASTQNVA